MHVCMYACMYAGVYACVRVWMMDGGCELSCVHACMASWMDVCMHMRACNSVCLVVIIERTIRWQAPIERNW
jgi:hypothetical protein